VTKLESWLSASETYDLLSSTGLESREVVRRLAIQCGWKGLRTNGFRQISFPNEGTAAADERDFRGIGQLWRYFVAAFWGNGDGLGQKSTLLEAEWPHRFRFRIEREPEETQRPCEVDCFIQWDKGTACYTVRKLPESSESDGQEVLQECWSGIQFDRLGVEALVRIYAAQTNGVTLTDHEIQTWIQKDCQTENSKAAWRLFKLEFGKRAPKKTVFEGIWKTQKGGRKRGRLPSRRQ
jgi:hypothetical protein